MQKYAKAKWKYHAVQDAVMVHSDVEEAALGSGWSDAYIEKKYPKSKYKPSKNSEGFEHKVVSSKDDEEKLGKGWHDSPAHFGIETTPGVEADQSILDKKISLKKVGE